MTATRKTNPEKKYWEKNKEGYRIADAERISWMLQTNSIKAKTVHPAAHEEFKKHDKLREANSDFYRRYVYT